jgi:type II secretory pathway component PulM
MQYKTIILELLQQRSQMHEQLMRERKLLTAVELYAKELKESHEAIRDQLQKSRPGSDPIQTSSEAFELALKELEDRLPPVSPMDGQEELSLDQAMAFIRNPSRRG